MGILQLLEFSSVQPPRLPLLGLYLSLQKKRNIVAELQPEVEWAAILLCTKQLNLKEVNKMEASIIEISYRTTDFGFAW